MTEVRFYHLTHTRLDDALPGLLEKTLARGWRAVVMTDSAERTESMAQSLWLYRADSFLPHGSARDGAAEIQPIWLTEKDENPNGASVLFLTHGAQTGHYDAFELVCLLFDGKDEAAVAQARTRWTALKGHTLSYWKQTEKGWEKEA